MEQDFVKYVLATIPKLSEESREVLRRALTIEPVGLECPSPGIVRFNGKQLPLQPRCWEVLSYVVRFGAVSIEEIEEQLSISCNEQVELDKSGINHIVSTINRVLRDLKASLALSGKGQFALQKYCKKQ